MQRIVPILASNPAGQCHARLETFWARPTTHPADVWRRDLQRIDARFGSCRDAARLPEVRGEQTEGLLPRQLGSRAAGRIRDAARMSGAMAGVAQLAGDPRRILRGQVTVSDLHRAAQDGAVHGAKLGVLVGSIAQWAISQGCGFLGLLSKCLSFPGAWVAHLAEELLAGLPANPPQGASERQI